MADHVRCERIRMLLSESGLDPDRMMCSDNGLCVVGVGTGDEGMPIADVERLCDKAIELSGIRRPDYNERTNFPPMTA